MGGGGRARQGEPGAGSGREGPGAAARACLRGSRHGALATREADGGPHVALVALASAGDGTPLLLLSRLARHSANLARDPRAALLVAPGLSGRPEGAAAADPLAGPRLTLRGRVAAIGDPLARARFLAHHPEAAAYMDFADFGLYRLEIAEAHFIAGFGRVHRLAPAAFRLARPAAALGADRDLPAALERALGRAVDRLAAGRLGPAAGTGWRIVAADADGALLARAGRVLRLSLPRPVADRDGLAAALAALAGRPAGG